MTRTAEGLGGVQGLGDGGVTMVRLTGAIADPVPISPSSVIRPGSSDHRAIPGQAREAGLRRNRAGCRGSPGRSRLLGLRHAISPSTHQPPETTPPIASKSQIRSPSSSSTAQ